MKSAVRLLFLLSNAFLLLPSCLLLHKPKPLLVPITPPEFAVVMDKRMDELSGLVVSRRQPGILYVHNDSGDSSRFFAIGKDASLKQIFYFTGEKSLAPLGVKDVEDITMGPGPDSGADYIYLGDIGDNHGKRKYITIYRIQEPVIGGGVGADAGSQGAGAGAPGADARSPGAGSPGAGARAFVDAAPLYLHYPDGARDAETLLADPIDRRLYIVSKREDSVTVYSTPLDFKAGDTVTLTRHTRLFFPGQGTDKWITAGDVTPGGDEVLLKSYAGVFYWRRNVQPGADSSRGADSTRGVNGSKKAEPLWQTLRRQPIIQPYIPEKQGEAIGFSRDGKGFYTISEGHFPRLYHYPLVKP